MQQDPAKPMSTEPLSMANRPNTSATPPNSREALTERVRAGRLTWGWPLVMASIRLPLLLLGQLLLFSYFTLAGHATPWGTAGNLWTFYIVLTADLGSLLLLAWLMRREGLQLRDLIGFDRHRLGRDLLIGLGLIVVFIPLGLAINLLSSTIVYGTPQPPPSVYTPPLGVFWWAVLVVPVTVGFMEEMTYRGYALPRLEALTGRSGLALLIMSLGFGMQHVAVPLVDWQFSLASFLEALAVGLILGFIYLRQRRLVPLIVGHWGANVVLTVLLILMSTD